MRASSCGTSLLPQYMLLIKLKPLHTHFHYNGAMEISYDCIALWTYSAQGQNVGIDMTLNCPLLLWTLQKSWREKQQGTMTSEDARWAEQVQCTFKTKQRRKAQTQKTQRRSSYFESLIKDLRTAPTDLRHFRLDKKMRERHRKWRKEKRRKARMRGNNIRQDKSRGQETRTDERREEEAFDSLFNGPIM